MTNNNPTGLIRKNELAMLYFPDATTPKQANENLRRWIKRCKPLAAELEKTSLRHTEWYYTPIQVKLIYEFLGEP